MTNLPRNVKCFETSSFYYYGLGKTFVCSYDSKQNTDSLHRMKVSHETLLEYGLKIVDKYDTSGAKDYNQYTIYPRERGVLRDELSDACPDEKHHRSDEPERREQRRAMTSPAIRTEYPGRPPSAGQTPRICSISLQACHISRSRTAGYAASSRKPS